MPQQQRQTPTRSAAARLACVLLTALLAATSAASPAHAQQPADGAVAPDPTLDAEALEAEAIALLQGFATAVDSGLPNARSALDAGAAYLEQRRADAQRIGTALRDIKSSATPEQRAAWVARNRERFATELEAWRTTLVRFEMAATDAEIVELNALVKQLTAPMKL